MSGSGGGGDRFIDLQALAAICNLEAELGKEIHRVFRPAIDFRVALLPAVAFYLGHGHSVNARSRERLAHLIEFEWLDDSDDELHGCSGSRRTAPETACLGVKSRPVFGRRVRLHKLTTERLKIKLTVAVPTGRTPYFQGKMVNYTDLSAAIGGRDAKLAIAAGKTARACRIVIPA